MIFTKGIDRKGGTLSVAMATGVIAFALVFLSRGVYAASPSSTTLICSQSSIPEGMSTSCSATVSGTSPTGMISYTTSGTGAISFNSATCTLSSGSCSSTVSGTAIGGVTVTATYSGDSNNLGSSGTLGITVTQASSTTSVSCNNPILVGTATTCTANVVGTYGSTTGDAVTFTASGSGTFDSASCALASGTCTVHFTPTSGLGSPQTMTAKFGGDANNLASSGTFALTVTPASPGITTQASSSLIYFGNSASDSGTFSGAYATLTGTLTFSAYTSGTCSGQAALVSSPIAVNGNGPYASNSFVPEAGIYYWQATFSDTDGSNKGFISTCGGPTETLSVYPAWTSTSVSCNSYVLIVGNPVTCTATVSSNPATPTGTLIWSQLRPDAQDGEVIFSSTSCTLSSGSCTVTVTGIHIDHLWISVAYGGTNDFSSGGGMSPLIMVTQTSTTTKVTCSPGAVAFANAISCTAAVMGGTPPPTGDIIWTQGAPGSGKVTFVPSTCSLASGSCSVSATGASIGSGSVTITGTYYYYYDSAYSDYAASSGSQSLTVGPAPTSTTVTCSPNSITVSGSSSCSAKVGDGSQIPSGTVSWSTATPGTGTASFSSGTCSLSSGTCSVAVTGLTVGSGSTTVRADYQGSTNFSPSSGTSALTLSPAVTTSTTVTLTSTITVTPSTTTIATSSATTVSSITTTSTTSTTASVTVTVTITITSTTSQTSTVTTSNSATASTTHTTTTLNSASTDTRDTLTHTTTTSTVVSSASTTHEPTVTQTTFTVSAIPPSTSTSTTSTTSTHTTTTYLLTSTDTKDSYTHVTSVMTSSTTQTTTSSPSSFSQDGYIILVFIPLVTVFGYSRSRGRSHSSSTR